METCRSFWAFVCGTSRRSLALAAAAAVAGVAWYPASGPLRAQLLSGMAGKGFWSLHGGVRRDAETCRGLLYLNVGSRLAVRPVGPCSSGFTAADSAEVREPSLSMTAQLAGRDIVVVSINYRVGPFGFIAHSELTRESGSSGNYGLQDMVAALRWVHANARALGADPQRITIAGQSAGAVAVDDLLAMPEARGMFSAAIAQSGSGLGVDAIPIREAEDNGAKFAALLGVTSVAQLRALPPEAVQAGIPTRRFGIDAGESHSFHPVLDGKLMAADPVDRPRGRHRKCR